VIRLFEGNFFHYLSEVAQELRTSHRIPWPRTNHLGHPEHSLPVSKEARPPIALIQERYINLPGFESVADLLANLERALGT